MPETTVVKSAVDMIFPHVHRYGVLAVKLMVMAGSHASNAVPVCVQYIELGIIVSVWLTVLVNVADMPNEHL